MLVSKMLVSRKKVWLYIARNSVILSGAKDLEGRFESNSYNINNTCISYIGYCFQLITLDEPYSGIQTLRHSCDA